MKQEPIDDPELQAILDGLDDALPSWHPRSLAGRARAKAAEEAAAKKPKLVSTNELSVEVERERARREAVRLREAEKRETERLCREAHEEMARNRQRWGRSLAPTAKELWAQQRQAALDNLHEMKLEMERIEKEYTEDDIMRVWSRTQPFHRD
jgi:hypothetical protein